jgi:hypothetical protein
MSLFATHINPPAVFDRSLLGICRRSATVIDRRPHKAEYEYYAYYQIYPFCGL